VDCRENKEIEVFNWLVMTDDNNCYAQQPSIGHVIIEALLILYLGNQRASLILIIQIALPYVSRIVLHTVSHTPRMRLVCVSNASRMRIITETRPTHNNDEDDGE
jgi:hypothetical protein